MDELEKFKELIERSIDVMKRKYPEKDGQERQIIAYMINNDIRRVINDIEESSSFLELWQKRLLGTLFLDCTDFTKKQIVEIIQESPLNERDRRLATMYWVDMSTEDKMAEELQIDRKTVRSNIPKISMILKTTASKLHK